MAEPAMGEEGWEGFTSGCFKGSCRPWIDAERTRRSFFHVSILVSITCWWCLEWRICSLAWIPICVDKSIRDQIRQEKKYCARTKSTQRHGLCHNFHLFSHFQAGGVWHGMPYVIKAARPSRNSHVWFDRRSEFKKYIFSSTYINQNKYYKQALHINYLYHKQDIRNTFTRQMWCSIFPWRLYSEIRPERYYFTLDETDDIDIRMW